MAYSRKGERLYSDKEIGALIQRATEIQEEQGVLERGLSLQEVEHIAAEMGIASEHLRTAALELESRPEVGEAVRFWGGPFALDHKQIVEGTVSEEQWEQIVVGLRRLTGSTGRTNQVGQTLEWTRVIKDLEYVIEETQVAVRPRADQTTIEVRKHYRGGAIMAYLLGVVFGVTAAGIYLDGTGFSDLVNTAVVGGSGIGGLAGARAFIAVWSRRQRQKMKQLSDWLCEATSLPGFTEIEAQQRIDRAERSPEQASQPVAVEPRRGIRI